MSIMFSTTWGAEEHSFPIPFPMYSIKVKSTPIKFLGGGEQRGRDEREAGGGCLLPSNSSPSQTSSKAQGAASSNRGRERHLITAQAVEAVDRYIPGWVLWAHIPGCPPRHISFGQQFSNVVLVAVKSKLAFSFLASQNFFPTEAKGSIPAFKPNKDIAHQSRPIPGG